MKGEYIEDESLNVSTSFNLGGATKHPLPLSIILLQHLIPLRRSSQMDHQRHAVYANFLFNSVFSVVVLFTPFFILSFTSLFLSGFLKGACRRSN